MNAAERNPDGNDYRITFRATPARLRAHMTGSSSFAATIACWRETLVEVRKCRPENLLLVDELRGAPLTAQQWLALVEALSGQGLEGVRTAHVRPFGVQTAEYFEIYACHAGFDARVFDNERIADLWLRYGVR